MALSNRKAKDAIEGHAGNDRPGAGGECIDNFFAEVDDSVVALAPTFVFGISKYRSSFQLVGFVLTDERQEVVMQPRKKGQSNPVLPAQI